MHYKSTQTKRLLYIQTQFNWKSNNGSKSYKRRFVIENMALPCFLLLAKQSTPTILVPSFIRTPLATKFQWKHLTNYLYNVNIMFTIAMKNFIFNMYPMRRHVMIFMYFISLWQLSVSLLKIFLIKPLDLRFRLKFFWQGSLLFLSMVLFGIFITPSTTKRTLVLYLYENMLVLCLRIISLLLAISENVSL